MELALLFLRATARGPLRRALAAGQGFAGAESAATGRPPGPLASALRVVGRLGGLFLSARAKVRIQEWLINRYRIPVNWQPREQLEHRFREAFQRVHSEGGEAPGDYLEFGVYQGNSLICAHSALRDLDLDSVRLFGFDSFAGLPETTEDSEVWSRGQFRCDYAFTVERLGEAGVDLDRTRLVRGFYSESLTPELYEQEALRRASVVMLDCDLYTSTAEALTFCRPLIQDLTFLFFDDWKSTDASSGQQRALREFRERHPELEFEEAGRYHPESRVFLVRNGGSGVAI